MGFGPSCPLISFVEKVLLRADATEDTILRSEPGGFRAKDGGAEGIRTPDPHNAIVVLYQLSYDPTKIGASEGIRTLDIHLGKVTLYQTELRSL
jgi:hypothetical protein